jgi:hypothetical protein
MEWCKKLPRRIKSIFSKRLLIKMRKFGLANRFLRSVLHAAAEDGIVSVIGLNDGD